MSNNQQNDQGYKSVIKEYDLYNDDINDFEVIDEIPTNYINDKKDKDNIDKNNENKKPNENDKIQNFLNEILKIIFYSRNKLSEFSSQSMQTLNDDKNNNLFSYHLEELTAYDEFKDWAEVDTDKKQKYTIDFILRKKSSYENLANPKKTQENNNIPNLLAERWKIKIKHKKNFLNKNSEEENNFIDKKMKIIEKDVILYSHILPLFNISRDKNYFVDFKFNPPPREKKNFLDKSLTKKLKLKMAKEGIINFKISITYLELKYDNINILLKKSIDEFVIIPSKKSRMRFLSDDLKKKSSNVLNKKESKEDNKNNNIIAGLIIDNYFDDPKNKEENNTSKRRRLSGYENKSKFQLNVSSQKNEESESDELSLILSESLGDVHQIANKKLESDKKNLINNNQINKKEQNSEEINNGLEEDKIKNCEFDNMNISKIVKEYKNMKKMMKMNPNYGFINCEKLNAFISNN